MIPKESSNGARLLRALGQAVAVLLRRGRRPAGDERSALVVDMAWIFTEVARQAAPDFTRAYLRFAAEGIKHGGNSSAVTPAGVTLLNPFRHGAEFNRLNDLGLRLLRALGKETGVVLLIVGPTGEYEVRYEFQDLGRWRITKLDGRTGVPEGL